MFELGDTIVMGQYSLFVSENVNDDLKLFVLRNEKRLPIGYTDFRNENKKKRSIRGRMILIEKYA